VTRLEAAGEFVAALPAGAFPPRAIELATLALVDFIGVALAGADEPVTGQAACLVAGTGQGACSLIGRRGAAGPLDAAFVNAVAGHALDFDDSNMALGGHPSVTMLPALLALAERDALGGRAVLEAYVVGFEVMIAMARAVNFAHYEKGWHPTATLGVFGTAAAGARLLGLDANQATAALGLAASMASGVKANFGTSAKPLQVGEASRRGVLCALLAAAGATASREALEGRQGFFNVYNGAGHYRAEALDGLGRDFEILRSGIEFKKYPCCGSTHAPIDAALALRRKLAVPNAAIAAVRVGLNARRRPHVDRPRLNEALSAKFSVQYAVAAALTDGAVLLRHFTDEAIGREDLRALMDRVDLYDLEDGDALSQGCAVAVTTEAGDEVEVCLADAQDRGADSYPGYMRRKFADCVHGGFSAEEAEALVDELLAFGGCSAVSSVMSRLAKELGATNSGLTS
jgi:2-methylcitrate dehydratase PrpD